MDKVSQVKMPAWVVMVGLGFGLAVLGVSVKEVRGEQITIREGEVIMEEEATESGEMGLVIKEEKEQSAERVDYYLPYPGILPDHPMYWLKMIRDRVQLWLVTDSEMKAEKLLLCADKRLGAGFQLVEGSKVSLGVTTLTKAEKYLEQAVLLSESIEGAEELREKLGKATRKHREVLMMVREKVGDEHRLVVEQMIKMTGDISAEVLD